jgi:hypothetical protein
VSLAEIRVACELPIVTVILESVKRDTEKHLRWKSLFDSVSKLDVLVQYSCMTRHLKTRSPKDMFWSGWRQLVNSVWVTCVGVRLET